MTMPGRSYISESYRYGYGSHEKIDEVSGSGNTVDMGDRWLDTRLGRTPKMDAHAAKYPAMSPYSYAANNPILFIDPDGKEWVNVHTAKVKELEQKLLDNLNDKKLKSELAYEQKNEARINEYLKDLKTNDEALYNYIDNLKVSDDSGNERNIKVYVSSIPHSMSGENGQVAETVTYRGKLNEDAKANYNGNTIYVPKGKGYFNFEVNVYGQTSFGDTRLANEAGDVMFFMEYNQEATKEIGGNKAFDDGGMNKYLKLESSKYSDKVEETYKQRKKDGTGKDPDNNPYPLKKDEK
jgi:RHS repeat-associated protein